MLSCWILIAVLPTVGFFFFFLQLRSADEGTTIFYTVSISFPMHPSRDVNEIWHSLYY